MHTALAIQIPALLESYYHRIIHLKPEHSIFDLYFEIAKLFC